MTDNGLHDDRDSDARLIRELSRLPSLSPSPGFSDRVMARVRLPQPKTLVLWGRAKTWALEPRRALALAGSYAIAASVALAYFVPWLLAHSTAIRVAADWAWAQAAGGVRDWSLAAANWVVSTGAVDWARSLPIGRGGLVLAGTGLVAAYAGCALGLRYLLREPRRAHVDAH